MIQYNDISLVTLNTLNAQNPCEPDWCRIRVRYGNCLSTSGWSLNATIQSLNDRFYAMSKIEKSNGGVATAQYGTLSICAYTFQSAIDALDAVFPTWRKMHYHLYIPQKYNENGDRIADSIDVEANSNIGEEFLNQSQMAIDILNGD